MTSHDPNYLGMFVMVLTYFSGMNVPVMTYKSSTVMCANFLPVIVKYYVMYATRVTI